MFYIPRCEAGNMLQFELLQSPFPSPITSGNSNVAHHVNMVVLDRNGMDKYLNIRAHPFF